MCVQGVACVQKRLANVSQIRNRRQLNCYLMSTKVRENGGISVNSLAAVFLYFHIFYPFFFALFCPHFVLANKMVMMIFVLFFYPSYAIVTNKPRKHSLRFILDDHGLCRCGYTFVPLIRHTWQFTFRLH